MKIKTHYQEVRELSKNLIVTRLHMLMEAKELEKERDALKKTFCDDGMEEVDRALNEVFDKVAQSQNDITELAKILQHYADELEASK